MITLNESTLQESMKGKFLLVQFGAEWCHPCGVQKKVLGKLEEKVKTENMRFGFIDTDKYSNLEEQYKVDNIPTVILFKNGQEVGRFEGARSVGKVKDFIGECIKRSKI